MNVRILRRAAGLIALSLTLAACGGSSSAAGSPVQPTPPPHSNTHPVIVPHEGGLPDSLYVPDPIRVHVGQAITWTNDDSDPHDVTARSGAFASAPIPQHGTWTWVPRKAGTYHYFCTIHPDMHGVIIVSPS